MNFIYGHSAKLFPEIVKLTPMQMFAFASFLLDGPQHTYRDIDRHVEVDFLRTYAFERAYRPNSCPALATAWEQFRRKAWPSYLKESAPQREVFSGELPF
jgi:hypothetical protein